MLLQNCTDQKTVTEISKLLPVTLQTVRCLSVPHLPPSLQRFVFTCCLSPLCPPLLPTPLEIHSEIPILTGIKLPSSEPGKR